MRCLYSSSCFELGRLKDETNDPISVSRSRWKHTWSICAYHPIYSLVNWQTRSKMSVRKTGSFSSSSSFTWFNFQSSIVWFLSCSSAEFSNRRKFFSIMMMEATLGGIWNKTNAWEWSSWNVMNLWKTRRKNVSFLSPDDQFFFFINVFRRWMNMYRIIWSKPTTTKTGH